MALRVLNEVQKTAIRMANNAYIYNYLYNICVVTSILFVNHSIHIHCALNVHQVSFIFDLDSMHEARF